MFPFRSQIGALFVILFSFSSPCAAAQMCQPFRAHLKAELPPPPEMDAPDKLPKEWEPELLTKIGKIETEKLFPKIYRDWLTENPNTFDEKERYLWLKCIAYYVNLPSTPHWTAIVDNRPSQTLFPLFKKSDPLGLSISSSEIPKYLRIDPLTRAEAANYQNTLFKKYGILALDYSDQHSPYVLKELLFLLDNAFVPSNNSWKQDFLRSPSLSFTQNREPPFGVLQVTYLYAFASHDSEKSVAAYHRIANAISVGGLASYDSPLNLRNKVRLLQSLAHEFGHAFIFQSMPAPELAQIAQLYAHWPEPKDTDDISDHYSNYFTKKHYSWDLATQVSQLDLTAIAQLFQTYPPNYATLNIDLKSNNIPSQYSLENIHEWFAEVFAASLMNRLGNGNLLGDHWRETLVNVPKHVTRFWSNYNNVSSLFSLWLDGKLVSSFPRSPQM